MLLGLSPLWLAALCWAGVALDCVFAEVACWHPLVGFGHYANWLERRLNRHHAGLAAADGNGDGDGVAVAVADGAQGGATQDFLRGVLAWALAVLPPVLLLYLLLASLPFWAQALLHALALYFCLGLTSLKQHTAPIAQALQAGDLAQARRLTSRIVSRDTAQADATSLSKAAVESLLENGNDAVFGAIFCFLLAGAPAVVLFRLANTLDAMWGYRNARFLYFGRCAARLDDVLNFVPARLTALSYLLFAPGRAGRARVRACWCRQSPAWPSPNAGPVMASGAASLGLALGGHAVYDGVAEQRPPLGEGRPAQAGDIARAWGLVWRCVLLWLTCLSLLAAAGRLSGVA